MLQSETELLRDWRFKVSNMKNFEETGLSNRIYGKNKTNHPISSNSHPTATANKVIHCLRIGGGGGGGLQNQREHHIILTKY